MLISLPDNINLSNSNFIIMHTPSGKPTYSQQTNFGHIIYLIDIERLLKDLA